MRVGLARFRTGSLSPCLLLSSIPARVPLLKFPPNKFQFWILHCNHHFLCLFWSSPIMVVTRCLGSLEEGTVLGCFGWGCWGWLWWNRYDLQWGHTCDLEQGCGPIAVTYPPHPLTSTQHFFSHATLLLVVFTIRMKVAE